MIFIIVLMLIMPASAFSQGNLEGQYKEIHENGVLMYYYYLDSVFKYRVEIYWDDALIEVCYSNKIDTLNSFRSIGPVIKYSRGGRVRSIGQNDTLGLPIGEWIFFYESGRVFAKENYERGIKHGSVTEYHENGMIRFIGQYNNPERGIPRYSYESKVGQWVFYYPDGTIKRIEQYLEGEPIKRFNNPILNNDRSVNTQNKIEVYPNGEVKLYEYRKSVKHGVWEYYDKNGQLKKYETYYKGLLKASGAPPQE